MNYDLINGFFECVGGLLIFENCRVIYRDKMVRGVSVPVTTFFTCWGLWNLLYYPSLDQWLSFYGGLIIVAANVLWVSLAVFYVRKELNSTRDV